MPVRQLADRHAGAAKPESTDPALGGGFRLRAWRSYLSGRVPVIATQTRAEVLTGLSALGDRRRQAILKALDAARTAPVSDAVVGAYATLAAAAKAQAHPIHQPIHTADRWIAATAIALGSPLLTADKMFRGAPGLLLAGAILIGEPARHDPG